VQVSGLSRITPASEHAARLERVRAAMVAAELETLICFGDVSHTANTRYFTDFRPVNGFNGIQRALLTIRLGREPVLFVAEACLEHAQSMTSFAVRPFRAFTAAVQDVPPRVGLAGATHIPAQLLDQIRGHFPEWHLLPTDALARVMAVKSAWEVARIAEAARLTGAAYAAMESLVAAGEEVTERDLARAADGAMIAAGADGPAFLSMVQAGERSAFCSALPTDGPVRPGDVLRLDVGARYGTHVADVARTITIGEVGAAGDDVVDASVRAVQAGLDVLRPGMTAGTLSEAIRSVLHERGYGDHSEEAKGRGAGNGIGMDAAEELPWIGPDHAAVLEPGMVFTLRASVCKPGVGGARTGRIVHVRESGFEVLDDLPMRLRW